MTDAADNLSDLAGLFGDRELVDDTVRYGPLVLTVAPKEGKAHTLLASHLFSPSLLLAEGIERGQIDLKSKRVVELGAGCALPSILGATLKDPPSVVVITDYPDASIMDNLKANTERNAPHYACPVVCLGYEWGADVQPLLNVSHEPASAVTHISEPFDVVIMSDLLHFDRSHDVLLQSLTSLLRKDHKSRVYVAAGKYTPPRVCDHFVKEAERLGISLDEGVVDADWRGSLEVSGGGLDRVQLGTRKDMCRWWTGSWAAL